MRTAREREAATPAVHVSAYLEAARDQAFAEIRGFVRSKDPRFGPILYDLVLDYPSRTGKGLRPALCIAACRALGGSLELVAPTAAVLELYHNAFLVHDDVEDGSEKRRGFPTLHRTHGVPIAVNTGDAMLALTLRPLIQNLEILGLGKTLRILEIIARMAEESAEGQALELSWIRDRRWDLRDQDYVEMIEKKTAWYSFITPLLVGATVAGANETTRRKLEEFGRLLGIAFQIKDDLLNIEGDEQDYGKERNGDLWEGKHTLILLRMLRNVGLFQRAEAIEALSLPRHAKQEHHIAFLADLIRSSRAAEETREVARAFTDATGEAWSGLEALLVPSVHREFLWSLVRYVTEREN